MSEQSPPVFDAALLREELEQEVLAMGLYLAGAGYPLPLELVPVLQVLDANERPSMEELAVAHAVMCEHVHPARPRTLAFLYRRGAFSDRGSALAAVPLVRQLMIVAVIALLGGVLAGMSPDISLDLHAVDPLASSGLPFLVDQVYFMLTATLGAAFYAITTLNQQIAEGTYDPRHDAAYWARIVLGIISGTIMSSLLEAPESSTLHEVGRNVLALLGGFSAGLVHRVLLRMVSSVESIFGSEPREDPVRPSVAPAARRRLELGGASERSPVGPRGDVPATRPAAPWASGLGREWVRGATREVGSSVASARAAVIDASPEAAAAGDPVVTVAQLGVTAPAAVATVAQLDVTAPAAVATPTTDAAPAPAAVATPATHAAPAPAAAPPAA